MLTARLSSNSDRLGFTRIHIGAVLFRQRAFTLVELVITLLLVGILAGIAVPRFFDRTGFAAAAILEETAAAIRLAQKVAIAGQCEVQVAANRTLGSNHFVYSVRVRDDDGDTNSPAECNLAGNTFNYPLSWPSESGDAARVERTDSEGVAIADGFLLTFNALGQPMSGGVTTGGSVSIGGRSVRVHAETGLVHVQ
jgi:MSHA pilin protein MshC